MPEKVVRSEEEWKRLLTPEQYRVLREKGTERPFVNEFDEHFEPGVYASPRAGRSCSVRRRNSIPAAAGPPSMPPRPATASS